MKKKKWTIMTALFTLFMYIQSMLPAAVSSGESTYALDVVGEFLSKMGWETLLLTEHLIRKSAHFLEYLMLGLLMTVTIKVYGYIKWQKWMRIMLLGLGIPFLDETIQLFAYGRSAQITDVWIDLSGVLTGTLLMTGIQMLRRQVQNKRGNTKDDMSVL